MSVAAARCSVSETCFSPRIFSDDLRRAAALGELLFEQEVLGRQPPLRQRPLDEQQQVIGIDRLGEKVERAFLHRRDGVLDVAECGHHDDRQLGVQVLRGAQHAKTIAIGQPEIGEDHGRAHRLKRGHRLGLIARFDDGVPLRLERVTQHRPQRVFVLDQQDRRIGCLTGARAHRSQPGGTPARRASS